MVQLLHRFMRFGRPSVSRFMMSRSSPEVVTLRKRSQIETTRARSARVASGAVRQRARTEAVSTPRVRANSRADQRPNTSQQGGQMAGTLPTTQWNPTPYGAFGSFGSAGFNPLQQLHVVVQQLQQVQSVQQQQLQQLLQVLQI